VCLIEEGNPDNRSCTEAWDWTNPASAGMGWSWDEDGSLKTEVPSAELVHVAMTDNSQRPKGRGKVVSALNMAIDGLNIAKEATSTTPVNPVFGSVAVLLTMIRVSSFLFRDEMFQAHT
jgi:hypothetical protein